MDTGYDVFLSFKGEVRDGFALPLYNALESVGLKPFMDEEDVIPGDELTPNIFGAIKNSKSAIVIFSPNYASSKFCLNELLYILQRREGSETFFIMPILYLVDMNDVQRRFPEEVEGHRSPTVDDQKIESWKNAFVKIQDTYAKHFSDRKYVKDFAQEIAALITEKLSAMQEREKRSMSLPKFIVLKSNYNERYLGYVPPEEFKDIDQGVAPSRNSFLRFDRDDVSTIYTKFEVEPAKIGDGLVHLKSCHNNKYWVRWSPSHYWIVAAADQPEEDRSKWSCTLFRPVYIDQNANTVRFIHVQLGHFACLWRIALPFGGCLCGGSTDLDQDLCDVFIATDWESLDTSRPSGSGTTSTSLTRNSLKAIATLRGDLFNVGGTIAFIQRDPDFVTLITTIRNIPFQIHALHIKTYGDISGGSASEPTLRDLGNFPSDDRTGTLESQRTTDEISLRGENSIIGRTIVVYSRSNPNCGEPLAWGVIGHAS